MSATLNQFPMLFRTGDTTVFHLTTIWVIKAFVTCHKFQPEFDHGGNATESNVSRGTYMPS